MALKFTTGQWIATFILLSTTAWMVSGKGAPDLVRQFQETPNLNKELFRVAVFESTAEPIQPLIRTNGITATPHQQPIIAPVDVKLDKILVKEGDQVAPGQVLVIADLKVENVRLAKSNAVLKQRQLEYKSALSLLKKSLISEQQLAEAVTQLRTAEQNNAEAVKQMRLNHIKSYVHGIVENIDAYKNQLMSAGTIFGNIVETSTIIVKGSLAEIIVNKVQVGDRANVILKNGDSLAGHVRNISPISHSDTRTFDFEVEIPQSEAHSSSIYGMTATIQILQPFILAHFISPALLQLDDQGGVGIQTVDNENRVAFKNITIVDSDTNGIWVSGLNKREHIIAQGAGFVDHGDLVELVYDQTAALPRTPSIPIQSPPPSFETTQTAARVAPQKEEEQPF